MKTLGVAINSAGIIFSATFDNKLHYISTNTGLNHCVDLEIRL